VAILLLLTCKKDNLKEKLAGQYKKQKVRLGQTKLSGTNTRQGYSSTSPRILPVCPHLSLVVSMLAKLAKEFCPQQHVDFDPDDGAQKCSAVQKKNETERFETWLLVKEEWDCGEFDFDIIKFF
jgi:hypothetical protein